MSESTTPAAPTGGVPNAPSGAADLLKTWGVVAALMGLLYAYVQANVESSWLRVVYQGFPIAVGISFINRVVTGERWSKVATWAMLAWAASIVPQVVLGVDEMIADSLSGQSERFGHAYQRSKDKLYLNRSADLLPSQLKVRESIYDSVLRAELSAGEKIDARMAEANKFFKDGHDAAGKPFGWEQFQARLAEIAPRVELGDRVHQEAMKLVYGPETPASKRPIASPWGIPHWFWLLVLLATGGVVLGWIHDPAGRIFTLLLVVGTALTYPVRGMFSDPKAFDGMALPHISWSDPANLGYAVIALLFFMVVAKKLGGESSH